jgi:hypothetical protein
MRPTAAERRAQHFAEFKREREQEEQERRNQVIRTRSTGCRQARPLLPSVPGHTGSQSQ